MLQPFADAHRIYHVIEPALRAPSVYNTQPWSFRITADDRIELRASPGGGDGDGPGAGRWDLLLHSPAPGPWAREYAISCGAALLNLRLAVRVLGHDPVVTLVPDPSGDPGLLASVEIVTGRTHQASCSGAGALRGDLAAAHRPLALQRHSRSAPGSWWRWSGPPPANTAGCACCTGPSPARGSRWPRTRTASSPPRGTPPGMSPLAGDLAGAQSFDALRGAVPGGAGSVDGGQRDRLRHPGRRSRSPPGEGPFPGPGLPARRARAWRGRGWRRRDHGAPAPAVFRGRVLSGTPSS